MYYLQFVPASSQEKKQRHSSEDGLIIAVDINSKLADMSVPISSFVPGSIESLKGGHLHLCHCTLMEGFSSYRYR